MSTDEPKDEPAAPSLALRALRALNAGAETPPVDLTKTADETTIDESAVDAPAADALSVDKPSVAEPAESAPVVDEPLHDTEPPESTEPSAADTSRGAQPTRGRYGVPIAAIVLVAAAVFGVLSAVSWYRAAHDDTRTNAAVRDAALRGARIDIETVNTSDYRDPSQVLDSWTAVSTGSLASQYKANRTDAINVLTRAKVVTKATVLDAAITVLDVKRQRATVIASVDVVRTPEGGTAARTRNRFKATVQKVGSSWLLSGLEIVAVQLS